MSDAPSPSAGDLEPSAAPATPRRRRGADDAGNRAPQQKRAQDSLARMLSATETLLEESGADGFTLMEVSRVGRVSIGSIYFRFDSKEALIRAVHERVMLRMEEDHINLVARARRRADGETAHRHIVVLIEEMADFLRKYAQIIHPLMLSARGDVLVQTRGAQSFNHLVSHLEAEILGLGADRLRPNSEGAIRTVIDIAYAAFARQLGLGLPDRPNLGQSWDAIRACMAEMAAAYLLSPASPALQSGPGTGDRS